MTDSLERSTDERRAWLDLLHRRYGAWFRERLVRRYGAQDADDVFQETWFRISRLCSEGQIRSPKGFLMTVASNVAFGRRTSRDRQARVAGEISRLDGWGVQDSSQHEALLARQIVMSLPQPLRDVFVLSRVGGLTNVQIAERLGISPKTVEWRMTKALAHCAAQLRR